MSPVSPSLWGPAFHHCRQTSVKLSLGSLQSRQSLRNPLHRRKVKHKFNIRLCHPREQIQWTAEVQTPLPRASCTCRPNSTFPWACKHTKFIKNYKALGFYKEKIPPISDDFYLPIDASLTILKGQFHTITKNDS